MKYSTLGIIFGIISAITYGMNPLGALPLYQEGLNPESVLFYRYSLAVLMLAGVMLIRKIDFRINKREFFILAGLGVLFASCSMGLFTSFKYMDAGIASTLLFLYPVFVALYMFIFFKEKFTFQIAVSIFLALIGVGLLSRGADGASLNLVGLGLVVFSAMGYGGYIVAVNAAKLPMSSFKSTFYVLIFCSLWIFLLSLRSAETALGEIETPRAWAFAIFIALVPTVISLVTTVLSVERIGSTPTAILGALEPLTAILIGVFVFQESFTMRIGLGVVFILSSVVYLVLNRGGDS